MHHSIPDTVAIIGGGPAGLMAAEAAATEGASVELFDSMPSLGRKFLLAGKGGLNLTHAEAFPQFISRYGDRQESLQLYLNDFNPNSIREWAARLGIDTFVGSSQRVFPNEMKAAPLLRAWLKRLRSLGVRFQVRHRWQGWNDSGELMFASPKGPVTVEAGAVVLALGGGSWPHLGSDGSWSVLLESRGLGVSHFRPANCGFDVGWSGYFAERFSGTPIKPVVVRITNPDGQEVARRGEFVITETGVEGSLIYALSSTLRDLIEINSYTELKLDLAPDRTEISIREKLQKPHRGLSISNRLKRAAGLDAAKIGLLRECVTQSEWTEPERLATSIKGLSLRLNATRPLDEAISTAGGLKLEALDDQLMVRTLPGLFCAGEMLDWEAPTGGYLLSACLATGRAAGRGAARWIGRNTDL